MIKPSLLRSSTLNEDEIKRIMSVIERDFKLRQKESKRIEELKRIIRQEYQRVEHLTTSKDFNYQRCIRCWKLFRRFFNPKELCSRCQLNVCHNCATYNKQTKLWTCKICLKIKELECLTGEWFYLLVGKKFKRCGSAKIVRQLYKRNKQLANIDEMDEDLGYGTLPTSNSNDSSSIVSYVVHDRNIRNELNDYFKRLILLIDNLKLELSNSNPSNTSLSLRSKNTESIKTHQQQIISEINRARFALNDAIRHSNTELNQTYENDLRSLLIQKTEQVLQTCFSQTQKNSLVQSTNFDQNLAQLIFENKIGNASETTDSSPSSSQRSSNLQSSLTDISCDIKSSDHPIRKVTFSETSIIDEEDDDDDDLTPTESSVRDDKSDSLTSKHRFIDTDPETIKQSTQRVDNWQTIFPPMEIESVPSDDEQVEFSTWL
ncbi:hypothetical protein I4U23_012441 [Adineta vaga]|nr:hypothetical protein I4U23_012441 [Adineta vaga]